MQQFKPGLRLRAKWALGIIGAWSLAWLLQGIRGALSLGSHPHPFLPDVKITGPMLTAVAEWALSAWTAYFGLSLICGFLLFSAWVMQRPEASERALGFKQGFWQGLGACLLVHTFLYWEVPTALATYPWLRRLPMGLLLLTMALLTGLALARGFATTRSSKDWLRVVCGCLLIGLLLHLPHDLFRRAMPRPPQIDPSASRVLVYSIDGCRRDTLEKLAPDFAAPAGVEPVVAVPATRLTWNMLLGGDPASLADSFVIPFQREWDQESPTHLLNAAQEKHLSTCFIIDDCTTLSFGLTRAKFSEVLEPQGGWKHFFSTGAGACWPAYSWSENFLSPVETTNPWADFRAYNRDVSRALERHRMVFSHTCQLHAPFFARREELQVLRPWKWPFHSPYAYQSYQTYGEAEASQFDRQDGRSNPVNSYRIRMDRLLKLTRPGFQGWTSRYPALSAVLTSDHGEAFFPVMTPDQTIVNFLTGMHGFTLEPDSVLVPLHAFGATDIQALRPGAFSWFDLRQCLAEWVNRPDRLRLKQIAPEGWLLSFPTVQATHIKAQDASAKLGAGITPATLAYHTFLAPSGIWFLGKENQDTLNPLHSRALVTGKQMVTFNPQGSDQWLRQGWQGYVLLEESTVSTKGMEAELARFPGKLPEKVFPAPQAPVQPAR